MASIGLVQFLSKCSLVLCARALTKRLTSTNLLHWRRRRRLQRRSFWLLLKSFSEVSNQRRQEKPTNAVTSRRFLDRHYAAILCRCFLTFVCGHVLLNSHANKHTIKQEAGPQYLSDPISLSPADCICQS